MSHRRLPRLIGLQCPLFAITIAAAAAPTVRASIVQVAGTTPGQTTLTVRLRPTDLTLGAYQGALRYAPGSLGIVSVATPQGNDTRVANAADSAKGIIRFAGFTVSGFNTEDVLSVVVRPLLKLEAASLTVELAAASDLQGKPVSSDRLIPARGVTTDSGRR